MIKENIFNEKIKSNTELDKLPETEKTINYQQIFDLFKGIEYSFMLLPNVKICFVNNIDYNSCKLCLTMTFLEVYFKVEKDGFHYFVVYHLQPIIEIIVEEEIEKNDLISRFSILYFALQGENPEMAIKKAFDLSDILLDKNIDSESFTKV